MRCGPSRPLRFLAAVLAVLDSGIASSTSLIALAELQPGRQPDPEYLADFLMYPNPHTELPTERTAFKDISRVLPE